MPRASQPRPRESGSLCDLPGFRRSRCSSDGIRVSSETIELGFGVVANRVGNVKVLSADTDMHIATPFEAPTVEAVILLVCGLKFQGGTMEVACVRCYPECQVLHDTWLPCVRRRALTSSNCVSLLSLRGLCRAQRQLSA